MRLSTLRLTLAYWCLCCSTQISKLACRLIPNGAINGKALLKEARIVQIGEQTQALTFARAVSAAEATAIKVAWEQQACRYHPSPMDERAAAVVEHYDISLMRVGSEFCVAPSQVRGSC